MWMRVSEEGKKKSIDCDFVHLLPLVVVTEEKEEEVCCCERERTSKEVSRWKRAI
jgi:hypothetical protein